MVQDISITPFIKGSSLALATPSGSSTDLLDWASRNRDTLLDLLWNCGGILFRGFQLEPVTGLQAFLESLSDNVLEYGYRSTPRSQVGGKIYTTTEYPKNQTIPLH